jgi:hypothetical protein
VDWDFRIGNWDGGAYTCGEGKRVIEDHRWERIGLVLTVALKSNEKDGKDSGGDTGANKQLKKGKPASWDGSAEPEAIGGDVG